MIFSIFALFSINIIDIGFQGDIMSISKDNVRFLVNMPKDLKDFLESQADLEFRSQSELAKYAIAKYLKECGYPIKVDTKRRD